jgi:hypothetical protein
MTLALQTHLQQAFGSYSIPAAFGASDLLFGWRSKDYSPAASTATSDEED